MPVDFAMSCPFTLALHEGTRSGNVGGGSLGWPSPSKLRADGAPPNARRRRMGAREAERDTQHSGWDQKSFECCLRWVSLIALGFPLHATADAVPRGWEPV